MTEGKKQIVIFKIGQERWGLEMFDVQEIIRLVEITPVPEGSAFVEGIINLRGKVIPIINMRRMMGIQGTTVSLSSRIVLIKAGLVTGFLVDEVEDILDVGATQIEPVPADFHLRDFVKNIIKLNEKLVILLDINKIMEMEKEKISGVYELKSIPPDGSAISPMLVVDEETKKILHQRAIELAKTPLLEHVDKKINLVVFLLNNEWYGVEEIEIREILRYKKIFFVPHADSYMEGIVNVRGEIIPVINLADLLGLQRSSFQKESRILVVDKDIFKVGLLVDKVAEIIELDKDTLQILSDVVSQEKALFFKGEFNWQNTVITLLALDTIIKYKQERVT